MDQHEQQELSSSLPILQRLDRLDRLLQFLEHKHCLPAKLSSSPASKNMELEDQCKTLASAIEEVHHKGTLIERVAMLENRVLQLSHEMDVENASMSSCSTIPVSEKIGQGSDFRENDTNRDKQHPFIAQESCASEACVRRKPLGSKKGKKRTNIVSIFHLRERFSWRRMGC